MMLVVDASVVVAALIDNGPEGIWAEQLLQTATLAAPHLMPAEAANILRRSALIGDVSEDSAAVARHELVSLHCELFAYESVAERVWALRSNVTAYDAWYVALAEALDCELATLDRTLSRASGPRCPFRLPPANAIHDSD